MIPQSGEQDVGPPRWRYLLLATLIFVIASAILAGLWQVPRLFPQLVEPLPTAGSPSTPQPPATPAPSVLHPTITEMTAVANDEAQTVTFHMAASVPPDRQVAEVILWYDTEAGRSLERTGAPLSSSVAISYQLDATEEGLTTTMASPGRAVPRSPAQSRWSCIGNGPASGMILHRGRSCIGDLACSLDYWWWVRDTAGESIRAGGSVALGPALQTLVVTPTLELPPVDFTWALSTSQHFQFHYVPGSAAERDLHPIGTLAEAALARTTGVLQVEFEGQMDIYLVPRVFWQGGAAYADKVQLMSYLDRNYTSAELWSYFTHEGTHALAQDLADQKVDGGSPDGVLVEGLAVWASDGHYHQDPIHTWAAVTAASGDYIPLADLRAGPFYDFQHETSYLEAASFVKFLIEQHGLDRLKELYALATGDATGDEALVQRLYGRSFAQLEAEWLDYLGGLSPTPEQARAWQLEVRSFDLMRQYETKLDPDARLLPSKPPTEWMTDTLQAFLHQATDPVNVALETALIASQARLHRGDLDDAAAILDDVEAALETGGELNRPSLQARMAILELLAEQDRAILLADKVGYLETISPAYASNTPIVNTLQPPFTTYDQEVVKLNVADDGLSAEGVVLLHAQVANGSFAEDGQLFAVAFAQTSPPVPAQCAGTGKRCSADGWLMTSRQPTEPLPFSLPARRLKLG